LIRITNQSFNFIKILYLFQGFDVSCKDDALFVLGQAAASSSSVIAQATDDVHLSLSSAAAVPVSVPVSQGVSDLSAASFNEGNVAGELNVFCWF